MAVPGAFTRLIATAASIALVAGPPFGTPGSPSIINLTNASYTRIQLPTRQLSSAFSANSAVQSFTLGVAPQQASCADAAAFARDTQRMIAKVEPDTIDDWRTHKRLPGCRVTAAGATSLSVADEAKRFYDRLRAAGWTRTPDPRDAPREGSLRFRLRETDCVFNIYAEATLGTDAEFTVNDSLRTAPGETRYQLLALCMPALPADPR